MKLSMLKPIRLVWVSETSNMLTGTSIFLSKRTSTDIIRNAIVSGVFTAEDVPCQGQANIVASFLAITRILQCTSHNATSLDTILT